jgi:hypothetical protein
VETRRSRDADRDARRNKINRVSRIRTTPPSPVHPVTVGNQTDRRRKSVAVVAVAEAEAEVAVEAVVERIHSPPVHRNQAVSKAFTNPCGRCVSQRM